MKHYRYKGQPDGYCMSRQDWVSLWLYDWPTDDNGIPWEPTTSKNFSEDGSIDIVPMTRDDWESIFELNLRNEEGTSISGFDIFDHEDGLTSCRRPIIPTGPPAPSSGTRRGRWTRGKHANAYAQGHRIQARDEAQLAEEILDRVTPETMEKAEVVRGETVRSTQKPRN